MSAATTANARLVEVDFEGAVCRPIDADGWPNGECGEPARYIAYHMTSSGGSHDPQCLEHARETVARCMRWTCRGAR